MFLRIWPKPTQPSDVQSRGFREPTGPISKTREIFPCDISRSAKYKALLHANETLESWRVFFFFLSFFLLLREIAKSKFYADNKIAWKRRYTRVYVCMYVCTIASLSIEFTTRSRRNANVSRDTYFPLIRVYGLFPCNRIRCQGYEKHSVVEQSFINPNAYTYHRILSCLKVCGYACVTLARCAKHFVEIRGNWRILKWCVNCDLWISQTQTVNWVD